MRSSPIVLSLIAMLGCGTGTQSAEAPAESGGSQTQTQNGASSEKQAAKRPGSAPKPVEVVPNNPKSKAAIEAAIRKAAGKPTGELSKADLE